MVIMNGPAPIEVGPVGAVVALLLMVAVAFVFGALVRGRGW
jgi:ABC-type antimicrobial peptide transport system permease subunit